MNLSDGLNPNRLHSEMLDLRKSFYSRVLELLRDRHISALIGAVTGVDSRLKESRLAVIPISTDFTTFALHVAISDTIERIVCLCRE